MNKKIKKITEKASNFLNGYSQFVNMPESAPFFKLFDDFIDEVENTFEPLVTYNLGDEHKPNAHYYQFWLNKDQMLYIKNDFGISAWFVFLFTEGKFCSLYSTGKYYYDCRSRDWRERMQAPAYVFSDEKLERYTDAFRDLYSLYETVKNNYAPYIENLQTSVVAYKRRTGVISRKTFVELNRKLPNEHKDDMLEWLDNPENAKLIERCLCYLCTLITPIEHVTTRSYFEACKAYYMANPNQFNKEKLYRYEGERHKHNASLLPAEATGKDWYYNYADGRDDGLMNVDEDSHEDYLEWRDEKGKYEFNGHHPWEIERGMSVSLDAHLQICDMQKRNRVADEQVRRQGGYCFILSWHPLKLLAAVQGFVHMRDLGMPVVIDDHESLERLLKTEDYIGIEELRGDIVHVNEYDWAEKCYGKICDCRFLPARNTLQFIRKVIWKPIEYNKLLEHCPN